MGERHLELLIELIELIERYARSLERHELEHDRETWVKVKGALETAAQCAIDLGLKLVAARGLGAPDSYRAVFQALARDGVIDDDLARASCSTGGGLRGPYTEPVLRLSRDQPHPEH